MWIISQHSFSKWSFYFEIRSLFFEPLRGRCSVSGKQKPPLWHLVGPPYPAFCFTFYRQEGSLVTVMRPGCDCTAGRWCGPAGEAWTTGTKDGLESCMKDQRCPPTSEEDKVPSSCQNVLGLAAGGGEIAETSHQIGSWPAISPL